MKNHTLRLKNNIFKTNHFKALEVKFLKPTNYNGDRIILKDLRLNKRIIISYDYGSDGTLETAIEYLLKNGLKKNNIKSFSVNEIKHTWSILIDDFNFELK